MGYENRMPRSNSIDINAEWDGKIPVLLAAEQGFVGINHLGADLFTPRDMRSNSILHIAALYVRLDCLQYLINHRSTQKSPLVLTVESLTEAIAD